MTQGSGDRRSQVSVASAWFPAGEWEIALERWPDLAETNPVDHAAYCRKGEGIFKAWRHHGTTPSIAPIIVAELDAYAEEHDLDPGEAATRSRYAADLQRLGRVRPWPPGRNDACWCGSTRKYKVCCGPEPPAA